MPTTNKSAFTSSPFVLTALTILGTAVLPLLAGITAPWALIALPILTGIYNITNAWVKTQQTPSVDDVVAQATQAAVAAYHAAAKTVPVVEKFDANTFGGMTPTEKTAAKEVVDPAALAQLQQAADAAAAALAQAQANLAAAQQPAK